jgi:parallel beta-helix repeat protein
LPTLRQKIVDTNPAAVRDYASLLAWEAGEQANLPVLDEIREALCRATSGVMDTAGTVTIDGWTTDATRFIRLRGDDPRPYRILDPAYYILHYHTPANIIVIKEDYVRIENLQVLCDNDDDYGANGITCNGPGHGATTDIRVTECIIKNLTGTKSSGSCIGLSFNMGDDRTAYGINNFIYGFNSGPTANRVGIYADYPFTFLYNNTIYGCYRGIEITQSGRHLAKNNIVQNSGGNAYGSSAFRAGSNYNVSDDATTTGGANDLATAAVSLVNPAADDLHLSAADVTAKDTGLDLHLDAYYPFSIDIDNRARPYGAAWDRGADEYEPQGGPPVDMNNLCPARRERIHVFQEADK